MAQLILSNVGSAIGSQVLPNGLSFLGSQISGAAIGSALGSIAGAAIDARYLRPPIEGPRIHEFHVMESREGASIPIVYGRMRVGGQVIWAARFKERRETGGGKGGPRVRNYSYSISFAVALCEGEVTSVSRAWANGEPFDLSKTTWRLYPGSQTQAPDPLIEAIETIAPAYRGVAYIVFEDMEVDGFGARLPQMSFEIVQPAGGGADRLEEMACGVNLIPGAGEFILATDVVRRSVGPGRELAENQHGPEALADLVLSLDQLQADMPNVSRVNLVVAWFGDDLRAGRCRIRPGVEIASKTTRPWAWSAGGVARGAAHLISASGGRPNYGGTPADRSVIQAVAELKARGFHVTLYPFVLMDIPPGNGLPDPHGGVEQAAFPWRGRIRPDPTENVADEIGAFFGGTQGYRAFVLHMADLAQAAGGVDGFLLGSELVGLTRAADIVGGYPAVDALRSLAAEVRTRLGGEVELSYAADWTEYGAHVREGGDIAFPLDPLWADDAIDYAGLDWYPPMADWRDGESHLDAAAADGRSRDYLAANMAEGEAFDWSYADETGRVAQNRLPITDGAHGEPWVFRQKDIAGWWSHAHHPRVGGVRSATSTAWTPGMKPIRFVEVGCPAIDKGANQPNVFYDPKSAESALPHFSIGSRDDVIQRRMLEAFHAHWTSPANNPASSVYDGRMLPADGACLWAWDARPYPAFPARRDVWADGENWRLGHWLNGRVGLALLPDVIADLCERAEIEDVDSAGLTGIVSGYRVDGPVSAQRAIAPLTRLFGADAVERDGAIVFQHRAATGEAIDSTRLVEGDAGQTLERTRAAMEDDDLGIRLRFIDLEADYAPGVAVSSGAREGALADVEAPLAMDRGQAQALANTLASQSSAGRDRMRFSLAGGGQVHEPGDTVIVAGEAYRILEASEGVAITLEAARVEGLTPVLAAGVPAAPTTPAADVEPLVVLVDPPPIPDAEDDVRPLAFAFADPWVGALTLAAGADATMLSRRGSIEQPCSIGQLVSPLYPHVSGRWQETSVWVTLTGHGPASRSETAVLNGANTLLVETGAGWEMVQFQAAQLVDTETYKLSRLLRGQQGTEPEMAAGAAVGARVLLLTGAEQRMEIGGYELGLELQWRAFRTNPDEPTAWTGALTQIGLARRAWRPVHLKAAAASSGEVGLSWTRRARVGGDAWIAGEPDIDMPEAYRVRVYDGTVMLREWVVGSTQAGYPGEWAEADFPAGGEARFEVAQIGLGALAGPPTSTYLTLSPA